MRRFAVVAGALALAMSMQPAAQAVVPACSSVVHQPGFKVIELNLPFDTDSIAMTIGGSRHLVSDSESPHYWMTGIYVVNQATERLTTFALYAGLDNAPAVIVHGPGVALQAPTPASPAYREGFHLGALPPGLPKGNYWVVFVWMGAAKEGLLGHPAEWRTSIESEGLDPACANRATGELYSFDHRTFSGTQVHAPGVGHSQELSLRTTLGRRFFAGMVSGGAASAVGSGWLEVRAGDTVVRSNNTRLEPIFARGGQVDHRGTYSGVNPYLMHIGAAFDVP